jgi:hypothetical protein
MHTPSPSCPLPTKLINNPSELCQLFPSSLCCAMSLPCKWLKACWVEEFCTAGQGDTNDEDKTYNADAIDKPDLFCWIRDNQYPQLTPKEFRRALRAMCRDVRPGYKPSPLHPDLRQTLSDRIVAVGKRMWTCQVAEHTAESIKYWEEVTRKRKTSPVASTPNSPSASMPRPSPIPQMSPAQPPVVLASATTPPGSASMHNPTPTSKLRLGEWCPAAAHAQDASMSTDTSSRSLANDSSKSATAEDAFTIDARMPLDDATLCFGLAAFGFGPADIKEEHHHAQDRRKQLVRTTPTMPTMPILPTISTPSTQPVLSLESLFPQSVTPDYAAELSKIPALLGQWRVHGVGNEHFETLEPRLLKCFSEPALVSCLVLRADRLGTGRPLPYASQSAERFFSVCLTRDPHVVLGIDSARKLVARLRQAAEQNAKVATVPHVWANTRDRNNNPCPRLMDMWIPRTLFNDSSFIALVAPHGTVELESEQGLFHAPFEQHAWQSPPPASTHCSSDVVVV